MFEAHFGLRENPFSTSHDPRFVYPSPEHLEAVAHFRYGMQNREAFVLVTGEVGTGKTTAVQDLVSRLPQQAQVALIQNTALSRPELMEEIARRFNVELEPGFTKPALMARLESALRTRCERGEFGLLVVDEAQNLSSEMLEEIRLLSNFELGPGRHFLICLVGQPELEERLARPELRQLRQRISVKYRLNPLNEVECARYVHHRIRVAGGDGERIFPIEAVRAVHGATHGIPRENNIVSGQAMLNAYVEGSPIVRPQHVRQVVDEFSFRSVVSEAAAAPPQQATEPPRPPVAPQRPSAPRETQPVAKQSAVEAGPRQPLSTAYPRPPAVPAPPPPQPPEASPPAPQPVSQTPPPPPPAQPPAPPVSPPPLESSPAAAPPSPAEAASSTLGSSSPRTIADWKAEGDANSSDDSRGMLESVKRVGSRRVPTPVVLFVIIAVLAASVMMTGIGRELWGVFFPPGEETAFRQEDPLANAAPAPVSQDPAAGPLAAPEGAAAEASPAPEGEVSGAASVPEERTGEETAPAHNGEWTIQAASFRTEAGAQRALGRMASATGLTGRVAPGTGESEGWFRVYLGSFPTRHEASAKSIELLDAGMIPEDCFPARPAS